MWKKSNLKLIAVALVATFIVSFIIKEFGYDLGNAESKLGDHDGTKADYARELELRLDPKPRINLKLRFSSRYSYQENTKDELDDSHGTIEYSSDIELDPNDAYAYYNRGNSKHELGDHDGAIADYDRAIELNPENAGAYFLRGNAKSKLGNKRGAAADRKQAIELDPALRGR